MNASSWIVTTRSLLHPEPSAEGDMRGRYGQVGESVKFTKVGVSQQFALYCAECFVAQVLAGAFTKVLQIGIPGHGLDPGRTRAPTPAPPSPPPTLGSASIRVRAASSRVLIGPRPRRCGSRAGREPPGGRPVVYTARGRGRPALRYASTVADVRERYDVTPPSTRSRRHLGYDAATPCLHCDDNLLAPASAAWRNGVWGRASPVSAEAGISPALVDCPAIQAVPRL